MPFLQFWKAKTFSPPPSSSSSSHDEVDDGDGVAVVRCVKSLVSGRVHVGKGVDGESTTGLTIESTASVASLLETESNNKEKSQRQLVLSSHQEDGVVDKSVASLSNSSSHHCKSLGSFSFPLHVDLSSDDKSPSDSSQTSWDNDDGDDDEGGVFVTLRRQTQRQADYWQDVLNREAPAGVRRANAHLQLGLVRLQASDYPSAINSLQFAVDIFRVCIKNKNEQRLRRQQQQIPLARALDRMGLAYYQMGGQCELAATVLTEAFQLRLDCLGQWHVDTVDTLNLLAHVYRQAGQLVHARTLYGQVFYIRQAIFGQTHPSVAVSAHDLAKALMRTGNLQRAEIFLNVARDIYRTLQVPLDNPALTRLMEDQKQLPQEQ